MKSIKFSHWFWITAAVTVTVVFQGQIAECSNDSEAKLLQVMQVGSGQDNSNQPFILE